jgi:hypothetical protein
MPLLFFPPGRAQVLKAWEPVTPPPRTDPVRIRVLTRLIPRASQPLGAV